MSIIDKCSLNAKQPRLLLGVEDIVAEMFIALEKAIRDVIKN